MDEITGFANFFMGESNNGVPAVVFRNCGRWTGHDNLYSRDDEDITKCVLKKRDVLAPEDQIQDIDDDADCSGDDHDNNWTDMNSPAVLALVIIDETRG